MRHAALVWFGLGGHCIEFASERTSHGSSKSSISGYDSPESFEPTKSVYSDTEFEGTPVIDKCAVLTRKPFLAIKSPLVNVDLADGEEDRLSTAELQGSIVGQAVMSGPPNEFGTFAALQVRHNKTSFEPGPLDSISVPAFIEWWRSHGARIGTIHDNTIHWEVPA